MPVYPSGLLLRRTLAQSYRIDSAKFLRQYRFIAQFGGVKTPSVGMVLTTRSPEVGWFCDGSEGSEPCDPLYGFTKHSQLFHKPDPNYEGHYTVLTLWDRKRETIVDKECSEIIRMFYTAFDSSINPSLREASKPLPPPNKAKDIETMNEQVYSTINNGVYKCGFVFTQEAYNTNIHALFNPLNRLESPLATSQTPCILNNHITEADIRLYPTIARFNAAYFSHSKYNSKTIRHDYPNPQRWLQRLYRDTSKETQGSEIDSTTHSTPIKERYTHTLQQTIIPAGPIYPIPPLNQEDNHQ